MSGNDFGALDLAGYVALCEHGYALPCYRNGPNANTWYTADCSIPEDHRGTIVGFKLILTEDIRAISPDKVRNGTIGSAWCDVFLWRGQQFVGTPQELWGELAPHRKEIASLAPLSLLDLAISANVDEWRQIAGSSFKFVQKHFGLAKARFWRRDTFFRSHVILYLRRLASELKFKGDKGQTDAVRITEASNGVLGVGIPRPLYEAIVASGRYGEFEELLKTYAEPFSSGVQILNEALNETRKADTVQLPLLVPPEETYEADNILLVALGRRAEDIARNIAAPEWSPYSHSGPVPQWKFERIRPSGRLFDVPDNGKGKLHLVVEGDDLPRLDRYKVIVALADDDVLTNERQPSHIGRALSEIGAEKRSIRLLAPALPRDEPARILLSAKDAGSLGVHFDAIVDTSMARSPFWPGYARRALERRIAEIVVGAGMLAATMKPLSDFFEGRKRSSSIPLLTFAVRTPQGAGPIARRLLGDFFRLATASESIGIGSATSDRPSGELFLLEFNGKWEHRRQAATMGVVVVRKLADSFTEFAHEVVSATAIGLQRPRPRLLPSSSVPRSLLKSLSFPDRVCAVTLSGNRYSKRLAMVAETPDIETLQVAADEKWAVIRYTDQETIEELLLIESQNESWPLPREVRLPHVRKLPQNKRFATRGVDPRDIVLLDQKQAKKLRKSSPPFLGRRLRLYRADADGLGTKHMPAALPRIDVEKAVGLARGATKSLLREIEQQSSARFSSLKRPSDLQLAWTKPARDDSRFAIVDGVLPVILVKLAANEVPAQKLFIVDGNVGVPALLQSRVFEVWARATLSRSTSWMSRFSVGGTFETFPVIQPFELRPHSDGSSLLLRAGDKRLYKLATSWLTALDEVFKGADPQVITRHLIALRDHPLKAKIDEAICDVYRLPPDATDLDILRRLLTTNVRS